MAAKFIITVMNQKGGTGKTTLSVQLAAAYADEGHRVLLIDNDPQGNATLWLGIEKGSGTNMLYRDPKARLETLTVEARPGLDLVPSSFDLTQGRDHAAADQVDGSYRLADRAEAINASYDRVIIDNNPGSDILTLNSLTLCAEMAEMGWQTGTVVPVRASALDLEGLFELEQSIANVGRRIQAPPIMAVVPSVADFRKAITKEAIEDLQIEYEGKVTSPARVSVRFEEAPAQGQTIFEYDAGGRGAKDYQQIAAEITHRFQAQQTSNKTERKA